MRKVPHVLLSLILLAIGSVPGVIGILDWIGRGTVLVTLFQLLPKWLDVLGHPLAWIVCVVLGFLVLLYSASGKVAPSTLLGPRGEPLETAKIPVLRIAAFGVLAGLVIAVGIWFLTRALRPESEVSIRFRSAYEAYKEQLGKPTPKERSAGALPEIHVHEHAMVIWSQAFGFYKLAFDGHWESERDPGWDDKDKNWWSTKYVTELFHPPPGKKPPYGGVAAHWYADPEHWQWIGWMNWQVVSGPDTIFFQSFEHGKLIGPLKQSAVLDVAQVAVILDDHTYYLEPFAGKIPPFSAPEQP